MTNLTLGVNTPKIAHDRARDVYDRAAMKIGKG